jgi:hypothetical protein
MVSSLALGLWAIHTILWTADLALEMELPEHSVERPAGWVRGARQLLVRMEGAGQECPLSHREAWNSSAHLARLSACLKLLVETLLPDRVVFWACRVTMVHGSRHLSIPLPMCMMKPGKMVGMRCAQKTAASRHAVQARKRRGVNDVCVMQSSCKTSTGYAPLRFGLRGCATPRG